MRRLLYSPRVFAFVFSSSLGKIVDVSDDIVSGWVDRNDNDMSNAELVLRNVGRKYVATPDGKRVFDWDDLITIWLQRMPGQPVQVFTGYLDSVPGWQMYPGDCRITASCTLKRLAYSWFDPGSMFFINMANKRGWAYDPGSGQGFSTATFSGAATTADGVTDTPAPDGGMAGFLYDFVTEVGGWDPSMVMIGELNPNLLQKAEKLQSKMEDALKSDEEAFAEVMRKFIGIDPVNKIDGIAPDGTVDDEVTKITQALKDGVARTQMPFSFAVFAAEARSGYDPNWSHGKADGDLYGYGLFRQEPEQSGSTQSGQNNPFASPIGPTPPAAAGTETIGGFDKSLVVGNTGAALSALMLKFNETITRLYSGHPRLLKTMLAKLETDSNLCGWLLREMGMGVSESTETKAFDNADRYIKSLAGKRVTQPEQDGVVKREIVAVTWDSEELLDLLTKEEKELVASKYHAHHVSLVPYLYFAKKQLGDKCKLIYPDGVHKESLYVTGDTSKDESSPDGLTGLFKKFKGHTEVTSVTMSGKYANYHLYMKEGVEGFGDNDGSKMLAPSAIRIVMSPEAAAPPDWVGLPEEVNTDNNVLSATQNGFTFAQLGQFSTIAALQAQYSFSSVGGLAESLLLTDNRALLNDISVLDAAKQLAQGSMRNLMSLPNGRLCAYYPDYFGANRGPYWYVREIEIINMGIQLTDGPLATHVYTTGDTTGPSYNGEIDITDRIFSRGVVSVFDVELINAFLVPGTITTSEADNKLRRREFDESKAKTFLNKHGARVLREENPIIKNPWYEFLMAWQRFMQQWAATFDTLVEFSFQPEVMPGGIIGFREHGLQMYCKQVRHTFSYESGFETTATLTSPAAIYDPESPNGSVASIPGMVIAGDVDTIAGGA